MREYIVEPVPSRNHPESEDGTEVWYCHKRGYDYIPVMGSIGSKQKAVDICRLMNVDGKVRYR